MPGHFRDVEQAADAAAKVDEGAVFDDIGDSTFDNRANFQFPQAALALLFVGCLGRENETAPLLVHLQHFEQQLLADFFRFPRLNLSRAAAIAEFGHVRVRHETL